jgi:hypothetical protein
MSRFSIGRRGGAAVLAAATALVACRDREPPPPTLVRDAAPARRVIVPAVGDVRPLPPHAIRADGVGPYRLGAALDGVLAQLPSGPRVALLDLQGVVDVSVVRAEDDGVLVGGESVGGSAIYIAVVRSDVARTESGVGVGSTRGELATAMGAPLVDPRIARDPELAAFAALPGARFVLRGDRVSAVLLRRREPGDPAAAPHGHDAAVECGARPRPEAALAAAGLRGAAPSMVPLCMGAGGEVALVSDGAVTVVAGDGDRTRRLGSLDVRGVRFAAPVRVDGRDELVVVAERTSDVDRVITVGLYRLEGGKLVRSVEQDAYRIAAASAGWIGARLGNLDALLEVEGRADALYVTGAFVHRQDEGGAVRDVAPLEVVRIPRRRKPWPADPAPASTPPGLDAGVPGPPDAAEAPLDAPPP